MLVVRALVDAVETAGVSQAQFLRAAHISREQLEALDARVTRADVYRLCELAIDLTGDPALGLHWSDRLNVNSFHLVSDLVSHARTLRQAFESLQHFHPLLVDHATFQLQERGNKVMVMTALAPGESPRIQRFLAEMKMVGFFRLLRMFNPHARPDRASFAYPAPSYRADYRRILEGTECFDQRVTALEFDRALMGSVSPHSDEDVHNALRSIAERRILRLTQRTPFALRVRDLMVQCPPGERLEMKNIARSLGLSVRSLRRRLSAEGQTYNAVANDALAIVAKDLVRQPRRTIQETAFEMGFSDASAFNRAFKRWTGTTPRAFRESQLRG